jgi:hypothetical protein
MKMLVVGILISTRGARLPSFLPAFLLCFLLSLQDVKDATRSSQYIRYTGFPSVTANIITYLAYKGLGSQHVSRLALSRIASRLYLKYKIEIFVLILPIIGLV